MIQHILDSPMIVNNIFFPRPAEAYYQTDKIQDGTIAVADSIVLGYRFYILHTTAPILLYFHGNGEIASDYDGLARYYQEAGVSLLVVDYRGYGWSTGKPLISTMLPDAQKAFDAVDTICRKAGVVPERPLFVKGRSLGSAPAIYLAHQNPTKVRGLIIESGFADAPSLFTRLGIPIPDSVKDDIHLPLYNARKMKNVTTPLLVIHGEEDTLIPMKHGKEIYENAASQEKKLLLIPRAGHNNLLYVGLRDYFGAIKALVERFS